MEVDTQQRASYHAHEDWISEKNLMAAMARRLPQRAWRSAVDVDDIVLLGTSFLVVRPSVWLWNTSDSTTE